MEMPVHVGGISVSIFGDAGRCNEFTVGDGEIYRLSARRSPVRIECRGGVLWVTRENDPRDYILERSQAVLLKGPGQILVQSLPRGKMCITAE